MTKSKKAKTFEKVEVKKEVEKKTEWECYTFIENISIWNDLYIVWERIRLTKKELKDFSKYVILTKDYKGKPIKNKARDCWC